MQQGLRSSSLLSFLVLFRHLPWFGPLRSPFLRPGRFINTPTRAVAVKAGRFFSGHRRLGLYMTEHDGRLMGLGRIAPPSVRVLPSAIANLCRLHRSLRGRGLLAASWTFESFGAAMSQTGSPRCRGKNRAVAEARPGRDDVRQDGEGDFVMPSTWPPAAIGTAAAWSTFDAG